MVYNCAQRAMTTAVNNNYSVAPKFTSFRGNVTQPVSQDTVELSTQPKQKKKRSIGKKILIGLGITASAVVVAALAFAKHQSVKLDKLYNEKLVKKLVDKEIVFTEAATKEEAIKYAKDVIGVQKIDENMTLEVLNYANKGITDVMNKNVGKEVFIPKSYFFSENDDSLAYVVKEIASERFGELGISKHLFDDKWLTKSLDERYALRDFEKLRNATSGGSVPNVERYGLIREHHLDKPVYDLLQKYKVSAESLTTKEKRILYYSYHGDNITQAIHKADWINIAEKCNLLSEAKIDIEKLKTLSKDKQEEFIDSFLKDNKLSAKFSIPHFYDDGASTIYHEMGHLQDFAKNLKELDLKKWKLPSFKNIWKEVEEAKAKGEKVEVRGDIDEVSNRWYGLTYGNMEKLFKEKPEKFRKLYPDLYEHLTNKEIQATAGKVSSYAQTSIGEFVAETYAKMIKGDPIPEDVLKLYKKYNGPLPNGF